VEFRQHTGTINAERIKIWIETVVGIVEKVETMSSRDLAVLLSMQKFERWQMMEDGKDVEREKEFGPLWAEKKFTIVHLLEHLGLYEPALFYMNKWKVVKRTKPVMRVRQGEETKMMPGSVVDESDREILQREFDLEMEKIKGPGERQSPEELGFDLDCFLWQGLDDKMPHEELDTDADTVFDSDETESNSEESGEGSSASRVS
jgi:hypothetical protein